MQPRLAGQRAKEGLGVDEQRQRAPPRRRSEGHGEGAPPAALRLGRHQRHLPRRARQRLPRRLRQRRHEGGRALLLVEEREQRRAVAADDDHRLVGMADVEQRAQLRLHLVGPVAPHPADGEVQILEHVVELGLDGARAIGDVDMLLRDELVDDARPRLPDEHRGEPHDGGERRHDARQHDAGPPTHRVPACRMRGRFAREAWRIARRDGVKHAKRDGFARRVPLLLPGAERAVESGGARQLGQHNGHVIESPGGRP